MSKVVLYMSMSVDGFIAGPYDGPGQGLGIGGEHLHSWLTPGGVGPGSHRPADGPRRLFDEMRSGHHELDLVRSWEGKGVQYLRYRVRSDT